MKYINDRLIVRKVKRELESTLKRLGGGSYGHDTESALYYMADLTMKYVSNPKRRNEIMDGLNSCDGNLKKYVYILSYNLLTYNVGGHEYGYKGNLNGKGADVVALASTLSSALVELGYFQNKEDARDDFDDFLTAFKGKT